MSPRRSRACRSALLGVMLNRQRFTKTAQCWGVANNAGGTNSNRIVLAERAA